MAKKILCVDDDELTRGLLTTLLEKEGFEVLTGIDGKNGIAMVTSEKPDLVLLDLFMPGMSGREVLEALKADPKTKATKVILLTVAIFSEVGVGDVKKLGCADYIRKPFDNKDLMARVNKALK